MVRAGNRNDELRWSLRSAVAHMPHSRVWIVGYRPQWLDGVQYLPVSQDDHKHANTLANLRRLADDGPDEFVLFHDDMFVLQPTNPVPQLHRGLLADYIERRRRSTGGLGTYTQRAVITLQLLRRIGVQDPLLSYELHTPMPMPREALSAAIDTLSGVKQPWGYAKRTLIGNLGPLGGQLADDCKVSDDHQWDMRGGAATVSTWRYVSTADGSFKYGKVGRWIRHRFPDPSAHEADARPRPRSALR